MIPEKYKIKKLEDDNLEPEETLIDAMSEHSAIETPIGREVFGSFFIFISIILLFLTFKAFQMQVVGGEKFAVLAERNILLRHPLSAVRGIIYDRNNQPLAVNVPSFDLIAIHSQLPKSDKELEREIKALSLLISVDTESLGKIFAINTDKATFMIKKGLSKEEVAKIKAAALPGIYVVVNSQRFYPDGPAVAHLLGYTAMVTAEDMKKDSYYLATDRIGRLGLEAFYESVLRGEHRYFEVREIRKEGKESQAEAGHDLILNIDQDIQKHLYRAIISVFSSAGVRRGAAVVQDPRTGAILGLVSMPSFDGNVFENPTEADNQSKISKILANNDQPLLNRVIGGRYSPGSTIKPLLALAGLKEGIVTSSTIINATGSISVRSEVDPNVFYTFRDWRVHGLTDIKKAIADSVDVFFYALGGGYGNIKGLGIDKIENYLRIFLADKQLGIDLPGEVAGFVPSREWKERTKGEAWYIGDTYNISIGQGDLLVTPLWLNTYVGSIANGGKLMKPFVVKEIRNPVDGTFTRLSPQVLGEIPFDQGTINIVKQGMRQTVLSGTATLLNGLPVPVAAKTGTAQIPNRRLNSLFTVFGPYDEPTVVMTVLVEDIKQSQGLAIRVANDFLMWYFSKSTESLN
jgi:penicillin-binding protein 2